MKMQKYSVIIPARLNSTRLPEKPIKVINGKPLIYWTWKNCNKVVSNEQIYVATDSLKIKKVCDKYGIQTLITSVNNETGTDRISEASKLLKTDLIINIQGDEPLIKTNDIRKFINFAQKNKGIVTNAYTEINLKKNKVQDINIPKVIVSNNNNLIYMSRSPLPGSKKKNVKIKYFKQVCIYGFPVKILQKIYGPSKKKTSLEKYEDIEILRVIENNLQVKMFKVNDNILAIDTDKDLSKAKKYLIEN